MGEVLTKSGALVFLIVLGYVLKCFGIFKQEDSKFLSKVMIYVTLPGVLLNAMHDFTMDISLLAMAFINFAVCIIMAFVAWVVGRKEQPLSRAMYMLCCSAYNIGSFSLPFIQFIFPNRMMEVVMFDVANSIMCCGTIYSVAALVANPKEKFSLKVMGDALMHSFPFVLYMTLLILNVVGVRYPAWLYESADIIAGGNAVAVMLMLGTLFEVKLTKTARRQVFEILAIRMVGQTVLALLAYHFLPFSLEQRQVLVLLMFCPISSMSTAFCAKMDCDPDVYGTATSLTIPISVAVMVGLGALWAV